MTDRETLSGIAVLLPSWASRKAPQMKTDGVRQPQLAAFHFGISSEPEYQHHGALIVDGHARLAPLGPPNVVSRFLPNRQRMPQSAEELEQAMIAATSSNGWRYAAKRF